MIMLPVRRTFILPAHPRQNNASPRAAPATTAAAEWSFSRIPTHMTHPHGKVYLVGGGPGDPGLITLRGAQCLARADAVLYDYLVNPRILQHAPAAAELICLGRHGRDRIVPQTEINQRMVNLAREGKTVVRLKGGDPVIFAHAAEEIAALETAGISYEIVPGITAALAAGSYAGIPLTQGEELGRGRFVDGCGFGSHRWAFPHAYYFSHSCARRRAWQNLVPPPEPVRTRRLGVSALSARKPFFRAWMMRGEPVSRLSKTLYLPLSMATSVGGGLLAGAVFTQIWKRIDEPNLEPPDPKDLERSTAKALTAAALQGLVFGLVRAAVDRAGAKGYRALAHESPR